EPVRAVRPRDGAFAGVARRLVVPGDAVGADADVVVAVHPVRGERVPRAIEYGAAAVIGSGFEDDDVDVLFAVTGGEGTARVVDAHERKVTPVANALAGEALLVDVGGDLHDERAEHLLRPGIRTRR